MKKSKPSGSSSRSRGSSSKPARSSRSSKFSSKSSGQRRKPSSRTSFFSRKKDKPSSSAASKTPRDGGQKTRFEKPPHDPGVKYRDRDQAATDDNYPVDNSDDYNQGTTQRSGTGCLGSISGIVKFVAFLIFVVVIVVFLKCGC